MSGSHVKRSVLGLVGLVVAVMVIGLVPIGPAGARPEGRCTEWDDTGTCVAGVQGAAGARCLRHVKAAGGISDTINEHTRLFVGGTNGPDTVLGVEANVVYCGFGGDDDLLSVNLGKVYGGRGDDRVEFNEGWFVGGPGDDSVDLNSAVFEGGRGYDTVILNLDFGLCVDVEVCVPTGGA